MAKIYWRVHWSHSKPFSVENAKSVSWAVTDTIDEDVECWSCDGEGYVEDEECIDCNGTGIRLKEGQEGYSCFDNPQQLIRYFNRGLPEPDSNQPVVAFTGTEVGYGEDGEPLVVPDGDIEEWTDWGSFKHSYNKEASILSPVKEDLDEKVWDGDKLKPEVSEFCLSVVEEFLKNFMSEEELPVHIRRVILIGSITGYQYDDDADLDINVLIDLDTLADNLGVDKELLIYEMRSKIGEMNGEIFPGTSHPCNLFLSTDEGYPPADGIYDMLTDEWVKKPGHPGDIDPYANLKDAIDRAEQIAEKVDAKAGAAKRTKDEIDRYPQSSPQITRQYLRYLKSLKRILDNVVNERRESFALAKEQELDAPQTGTPNVVYKYLEYNGLLDTLHEAAKTLERYDETGSFTEEPLTIVISKNASSGDFLNLSTRPIIGVYNKFVITESGSWFWDAEEGDHHTGVEYLWLEGLADEEESNIYILGSFDPSDGYLEYWEMTEDREELTPQEVNRLNAVLGTDIKTSSKGSRIHSESLGEENRGTVLVTLSEALRTDSRASEKVSARQIEVNGKELPPGFFMDVPMPGVVNKFITVGDEVIWWPEEYTYDIHHYEVVESLFGFDDPPEGYCYLGYVNDDMDDDDPDQGYGTMECNDIENPSDESMPNVLVESLKKSDLSMLEDIKTSAVEDYDDTSKIYSSPVPSDLNKFVLDENGDGLFWSCTEQRGIHHHQVVKMMDDVLCWGYLNTGVDPDEPMHNYPEALKGEILEFYRNSVKRPFEEGVAYCISDEEQPEWLTPDVLGAIEIRWNEPEQIQAKVSGWDDDDHFSMEWDDGEEEWEAEENLEPTDKEFEEVEEDEHWLRSEVRDWNTDNKFIIDNDGNFYIWTEEESGDYHHDDVISAYVPGSYNNVLTAGIYVPTTSTVILYEDLDDYDEEKTDNLLDGVVRPFNATTVYDQVNQVYYTRSGYGEWTITEERGK